MEHRDQNLILFKLPVFAFGYDAVIRLGFGATSRCSKSHLPIHPWINPTYNFQVIGWYSAMADKKMEKADCLRLTAPFKIFNFLTVHKPNVNLKNRQWSYGVSGLWLR